jgi:23S rRNA-/tRNA-specific pseudouridylate synthase
VRLDAYLASQLPDASRAKISASIKAGLVTVNAAAVTKPSQAVRGGDRIDVCLLPPEPCTVCCAVALCCCPVLLRCAVALCCAWQQRHVAVPQLHSTSPTGAALCHSHHPAQCHPACWHVYNPANVFLVRCSALLCRCWQAIPEAIPLDVVYEDEHLIVVNKVRLHPCTGKRAGWGGGEQLAARVHRMHVSPAPIP